jgi:hypothetical protein
MDLLAKLEHTLEGMVEGVFSRAFKAPLQPIEVAKRLTREMEQNRTVSVNATYVPNAYAVALAPDTYQSFMAISTVLLGELEEYLRSYIQDNHYQTVGPVAVRLVEQEGLRGNEMLIATTNEAPATPSVPPAPAVLRSDPPNITSRAAPPRYDVSHHHIPADPQELEITGGEAQGKRFPLHDGLSIGRGSTNTLVLMEAAVSRHHAHIAQQEGAWVISDQGSTNGTFINERRITPNAAHMIHPGDVINIGETMILVR